MRTIEDILAEVDARDYVVVPPDDGGNLVIVRVGSRDEFDRIALPCAEHRLGENHWLSKSMQRRVGRTDMRVAFHFVVTRP